MNQPVKVIVVDDSPTVRNILSRGLAKDPRIQVVAEAGDAYKARDLIVEHKPDVITLDLDMPRMNGLEFIQILMKHWPLPIVVVSSLVDGRNDTSIKALEAGAVEIFPKPITDLQNKLPTLISKLADLLVQVSKARVGPRPSAQSRPVSRSHTQAQIQPVTNVMHRHKIIAIGASTGGTEAIREVLQNLPGGLPGVVMVQHMPEGFTLSFAERLNNLCPQLQVKEAKDGDRAEPGTALLAPGNYHMLLRKDGQGFYVEVRQGPLVNRHRPAVDVLFHSTAEAAGRNAVGVILTGMGADGAKGMKAMKDAGAFNIAQDEASCVVYGMPREAVSAGGVDQSLPLSMIAARVASKFNGAG